VELRTNSYFNKAAILHIDRRKQFKEKLRDKDCSNYGDVKKSEYLLKEKF
jgi:hypothetical protein